MNLSYAYSRASGPSRTDCHVIVLRSELGQGFRPGEGDSWLVSFEGQTVATHLKKAGWYTDVWRSAGGRVYVTDADGFVQHGAATVSATTWDAHSLPATLQGIWGLDDEHVYAWGLGPRNQSVLFRWDGSAWRDMPSPDPERRVLAMHGVRDDLVMAVGTHGLIARWNGSAWQTLAAPAAVGLGSVFVESDDEMYACGQDGVLVQGSVHGWQEVIRGDDPLIGVVKWAGDVWVATWGELGLAKLSGDRLESVKPKLQLIQLVASEELVYLSLEKLGSTPDGQSFRSQNVAAIARAITDPQPEGWNQT